MSKKTEKELMDLGQKLKDLYETGYVDRKQAIWFSFLKGLAGGFGAFLGGTILIGILLAILSLFTEIPFLGHLVESFRHTLERK